MITVLSNRPSVLEQIPLTVRDRIRLATQRNNVSKGNETHIVVFVYGLPADLLVLEIELFHLVGSDGTTLNRLRHEPAEVGVQVFEVHVRVVRVCNSNTDSTNVSRSLHYLRNILNLFLRDDFNET